MIEFFRTYIGKELLSAIKSIAKSLAIIAQELQKMNSNK